MVTKEELRVEGVLANMRRIGDFVREFGHRHGLTEDMSFDVDLAVEEALINIMRHAYKPGHVAGDLLVQVKAGDNVLCITLTDWGLPFDSEDWMPPVVDAPLEARAKGGMGLHLIYELMDSVIREATPTPGGPNVIILCKRLVD